MLYIFMGQSCTGKSTAADKIRKLKSAEVYSGKDYLRMAKNENEAWKLFCEKLSDAVSSKETMIYLVAEREQLEKISHIEGACRVKFTASLDTIKSRFAERMNGRLPAPVERMLTKQYEEWAPVEGEISVDTTVDSDAENILSQLEIS